MTSPLTTGRVSNDEYDERRSEGQTAIDPIPPSAEGRLYPDLVRETPPQSALMEIQNDLLPPASIAAAPPADSPKEKTQPPEQRDPTQQVQSTLQTFDPLGVSADSNHSATAEPKPAEEGMEVGDNLLTGPPVAAAPPADSPKEKTQPPEQRDTTQQVQSTLQMFDPLGVSADSNRSATAEPKPAEEGMEVGDNPLTGPPVAAAPPVDSTKKKTQPSEPRDPPQQCQPMVDPLEAPADSVHWATSEPKPTEEKEFRILLIGKTGNGKSSLCNSILGERRCAVGRGMKSTTTEAQLETADVLGKRLKIIDTPDLSNLTTDEATLREHVKQLKDVTQRSPHVIILTVRCDIRYTKEEHAIYLQVRELWGDNSIFRQRLMVAFTFGDRQDEDLGEELKEVNEELKSVMDEAGWRYVQVNNKLKDEAEKAEQLRRICGVMDSVIAQTAKPMRPPRPSTGPQANKGWALLIVGTTGHGKSSLANLILGEQFFDVGTGFCPVTEDAVAKDVPFANTISKIIDTPDLKTLLPANIHGQISKWKTLAYGCRAVFLLVIRCDVRYTSEEKEAFEDILKYWSEHSPWMNYEVIVVFTFKDRLDYVLKDHLGKSEDLKRVLEKAGKRWIEVNSKLLKAERGRKVNDQERNQALCSLWEYLGHQSDETTYFDWVKDRRCVLL